MKRLALFSLGVATMAGCFASSASVESLAHTMDSERFPAGMPGARMTEKQDLRPDISEAFADIIDSAHLKELTFAPLSGVTRLGFIDTLSVTAPARDKLPEVLVAQYRRGMQRSNDGTLAAELFAVDLAPYLKAKSSFTFVISAIAPTQSWSFRVSMDLRASLNVQ